MRKGWRNNAEDTDYKTTFPMEQIKTKHGYAYKCTREELEEVKKSIIEIADREKEKRNHDNP